MLAGTLREIDLTKHVGDCVWVVDENGNRKLGEIIDRHTVKIVTLLEYPKAAADTAEDPFRQNVSAFFNNTSGQGKPIMDR